MTFLLRISLVVFIISLGANSFSGDIDARAKKVKTYNGGLGFSFDYSDEQFGDLSCVDCDDVEKDGSPILNLNAKVNPPGVVEIVYGGSLSTSSTKEYLDDRKKYDYEIFHLERLQGHLVFDVFLQALPDAHPNFETNGSNFTWKARGFCNGHMLTVTFDYYPKPDKTKRADIKSSGVPPQHYYDFLRSVRCASWSDVPSEKTFKSPSGAVEVVVKAEKKITSGNEFHILYTYSFKREGHTASLQSPDTVAGIPHFERAFSRLKWSPDEKTVQLYNQVRSLAPGSKWANATTSRGELSWLDNRYALQNQEEDCGRGFLLFDAEKGKELALEPKTPNVSFSFIGKPERKKVQVLSTTGICSAARVVENCFELDFKKPVLKKISCPNGAKNKGPS
ncbi:hypothetical protein [Bdellovibrio sp. KM01]|uniref:hypothetical protein n=1 Tax=Bdellovibrio sp. KM01 TaxID=2748865 RepID=UPI0015E901F8|nr:hypothetical protein [Bdellovibrio sp. KM01]QLY26306.1 hypothetical protein HW988_04555 [Bdellovibrio sp. KM01]